MGTDNELDNADQYFTVTSPAQIQLDGGGGVATMQPVSVAEAEEEFAWKEFSNPLELVEHIANVPDLRERLVGVPEWGVKILVKGLPAVDRNEILQNAMKGSKDGQPNMVLVYPDLIIASCYHPQTGKKLFTTAHRGMLNSKSGAAMDRLTNAINELSAFGSDNAGEIARKN